MTITEEEIKYKKMEYRKKKKNIAEMKIDNWVAIVFNNEWFPGKITCVLL